MPDKTEAPTPRRLHEAKQKGQVARSNEVNTALILIVAFWLLRPMTLRLADTLGDLARACLAGLSRQDLTWATLSSGGMGWMMQLGLALLPFSLALMVAGVGVNVMQTGLVFSFQGIKPNLSKLNPLSGLKRMFSREGLVELAKAIVKLTLVTVVADGAIRRAYPVLLGLPRDGLAYAWLTWRDIALDLGVRVGTIYLGLAAADYAFQRWSWFQGLRMTRQELKEELRQSEGDPQLKGRLRQRQRYIVQSRMMAAVPKADVVVTNPTHLAVALKYDSAKMRAPQVSAKGARLLAERIKELAREHGVPVIEDKPLAQTLYRTVEVGQEIPTDLYAAVAGVLAFVYSLKRKRR